MSDKNKKDLLKEELARFNQINEFKFYEDIEAEESEAVENLLLGNEISEEEEEMGNDEGGDEEISDDDIEIPGEEGEEDSGDEDPFGGDGEEESDDSGDEDPFGDEEGGFGGDDAGEDMEMAPDEDPLDDAVELDVTELVKGSEEAKASADSANQKIDQLMGMIDNLDNQVSSMSQISTKIDSLENELEKRAPTPNEKLEMISMDSAPFNMRLGDFWKDQEGQYDVMSDDKKEQEYVLDKKSIESDYSDVDVKDSLDTSNEYEEEEF